LRVAAGDECILLFSRSSSRASDNRVSIGMRAYVRACLSFFRNRRRVGGAKLEDAEEGRRPVINGTRETAFLESLLVLLFAAQRRLLRDEWANERTRFGNHPCFRRCEKGGDNLRNSESCSSLMFGVVWESEKKNGRI